MPSLPAVLQRIPLEARTSISTGNTKLDSIPSLSLPPVTTCLPGALCITDGCYALNMLKGPYKANILAAWERNLRLWLEDPRAYWAQVHDFLRATSPALFRFNVGGNIPEVGYLWSMVHTAHLFPKTQFMAYTKREDILTVFGPDNLREIPTNFVLRCSVWPTVPIPAALDSLPKTYVSEDPRAQGVMCPGHCATCRACWSRARTQIPRH